MRMLEAAEYQRAAGCHFNRRNARVQLARRHPEQLLAARNADRTPFMVVGPFVEAALDWSVALFLCPQWIEPVRAAVFKAFQLIAEALHENRTPAELGG